MTFSPDHVITRLGAHRASKIRVNALIGAAR
jgi:hypothetical protein